MNLTVFRLKAHYKNKSEKTYPLIKSLNKQKYFGLVPKG